MAHLFRGSSRTSCLLAFVAALLSVPVMKSADTAEAAARAAAVRGSLATYSSPPRTAEGRVNVAQLVTELTNLHVNTYHWLIWMNATDWEDLKLFLPAARERHIGVWACLVPPSESPPKAKNYSEPFRLDYERWAIEFARLSLAEPNLVAWTIDDFSHNLKIFTPQRVRAIVDGSRAINPRLAFVPCMYFPGASKAEIARDYAGLLDGLLFPYRHESQKADLTDATLVEPEVRAIKAVWGASFPVIVDVYSTAHSRLGASTPAYVRDVMTAGHRCADGVHVYTHPRPGTEKSEIARKLFTAWTSAQ